MDRRTSLKLLIALATALSPLARAATTDEAHCASALAEGIDVAALAQLASQVRRAHPESVDSPSIAPLLQASSASFDETLALLRKRMTEDFTRGRVVDLFGWRVSRMEANLFLALHECAQSQLPQGSGVLRPDRDRQSSAVPAHADMCRSRPHMCATGTTSPASFFVFTVLANGKLVFSSIGKASSSVRIDLAVAKAAYNGKVPSGVGAQRSKRASPLN